MTRNGLYLQATMVHLGLSRAELASVCGVNVRTVGNWIAGRNAVPDVAWSKIAAVTARVHEHAETVLRCWREQGSPKVFNVPVTSLGWEGPALVAAWLVLDALEAEHVHATLVLPFSRLLT